MNNIIFLLSLSSSVASIPQYKFYTYNFNVSWAYKSFTNINKGVNLGKIKDLLGEIRMGDFFEWMAVIGIIVFSIIVSFIFLLFIALTISAGWSIIIN